MNFSLAWWSLLLEKHIETFKRSHFWNLKSLNLLYIYAISASQRIVRKRFRLWQIFDIQTIFSLKRPWELFSKQIHCLAPSIKTGAVTSLSNCCCSWTLHTHISINVNFAWAFKLQIYEILKTYSTSFVGSNQYLFRGTSQRRVTTSKEICRDKSTHKLMAIVREWFRLATVRVLQCPAPIEPFKAYLRALLTAAV